MPAWVAEQVGLGRRLAGKTLANFHPEGQPAKHRAGIIDALTAAKAFVDKPRTLVFSGPNGVGKTHLAAAIANALIEKRGWRDPGVLFINFADMLRAVRSTYGNQDGPNEETCLRRWRNIPVLIVDEIGQAGLEERPSEFTRRIAYDVIDGRYRKGNRPIVITTNKGPVQLAEWITESGVSRLYELGDVLLMTGEDWRLRR